VYALSGFVALIDPTRRHAGTVELALTTIGVLAFIGLYAWTLWEWKRGRSGLWHTLAIALIGALFAPFNSAAWVFFVVAAAFSPCVAAGNVRTVVLIVGGIIAIALIEKIVLDLSWSSLGLVVGAGIPTALMCTATVRRAIAVRELARHSERERISRDMHDVLGHTLSVIILKTDLAMRLAHRDPDRVVEELTEVDRIARETLDEVRETLRGYRARSLKHEIELARHTLTIAGIKVTEEFEPVQLDPTQENALCLAIREGVTNIVRHARARHCRLSVAVRDGSCFLEIEDDGEPDTSAKVATGPGGAGLQGMRERVAASGGTVTQRMDRGMRLTVALPLAP